MVSHLGPDRKQMWKFWFFFIDIGFFDTQNTSFLIVKGLKNAIFTPLSWLSKWGVKSGPHIDDKPLDVLHVHQLEDTSSAHTAADLPWSV